VSDLTPEEVRILRAAAEGRMGVNRHGRYAIDNEVRPDPRARNLLMRKGLLLWPHYQTHRSRLTDEGRAALDREELNS
jgi:hypothetical protein